jgi:hypothetical protein
MRATAKVPRPEPYGPRTVPRHPARTLAFDLAKAGLLARGSLPRIAFPELGSSGYHDARLAAYSCGGSHGIGPERRHRVPFSPLKIRGP